MRRRALAWARAVVCVLAIAAAATAAALLLATLRGWWSR